MKKYTPRQGDIVLVTFDPRLGHEQKGRRPGLIVSNAEYHKRTNNIALICPITNTISNLPIHVKLKNTETTGEIMCEQILCVDLSVRKVEFIEYISDDILDEAIDLICSFIE